MARILDTTGTASQHAAGVATGTAASRSHDSPFAPSAGAVRSGDNFGQVQSVMERSLGRSLPIVTMSSSLASTYPVTITTVSRPIISPGSMVGSQAGQMTAGSPTPVTLGTAVPAPAGVTRTRRISKPKQFDV